MSAQDTEQEPSIEEILDSIRQIISDDEDDATGGEEEGVAVSEPEPEDDDFVELTQKLDPEPIEVDLADPAPAAKEAAATQPAPPAMPEAADEPEAAAPEVKPEPEPPEVNMKESEPESEEEFDPLMTRDAEKAAYEGFAELARKTAIEHDGITIEEVVRTELRPLLRDWLDKNLPSIIQRLVQEELDRIAKRALEE